MDITLEKRIETFFTSSMYGVVGASSNREKFGNKVLRVYLQNNKKVFPINPHEKSIEGIACLNSVIDLPNEVKSISIITPPNVTKKIVEEAITKQIKNIWMQPGVAYEGAIKDCEANNINLIANGPCILVYFGFHE